MTEFDATTIVKAARSFVERKVTGTSIKIELSKEYDEPRGVFVTLNTFPEHTLRGCIGIPYPVMPLRSALEAAAEYVVEDPRFPILKENELNEIIVEVTVLSIPEPISCSKDALDSEIKIGVHGLILECRGRSGLLLPQVPVEQGWNLEEYLCYLSIKAGLPQDAWKWNDSIIKKFTGSIFKEKSPNGETTEVEYGSCH